MKSFQYYRYKYSGYIIPSIVIIFVCQLIPSYMYSGLQTRINILKNASIVNQEIIDINTLKFKSSGKRNSIYPEIVLHNTEKHPIILENRKNEKDIEIGSIVNKKGNTNYFTLNNNPKKYFIRDFHNAKIFLKIFMFIISLIGIYQMITQTEKTNKK